MSFSARLPPRPSDYPHCSSGGRECEFLVSVTDTVQEGREREGLQHTWEWGELPEYKGPAVHTEGQGPQGPPLLLARKGVVRRLFGEWVVPKLV